MKKLFVLFLLVALVPFTVGCGLFGDNDDTTAINLVPVTASVGGVAKPSIRAALSNFAGYTLKIGDVTLQAYDEVIDNAPTLPATYKIMFRALVAPAVVTTLAANTTQTKVELFLPGATTAASTIYVPIQSLTSTSEVVLTRTATGFSSTVTINPTVGSTTGATTVTGGTNAPVNATVTYNSVAVSTNSAAPTALIAGNNKFAVALATGAFKSTTKADIKYSVKVKNILGNESALDTANVDVTMLTTSTAEIMFMETSTRTLKTGNTYQVSVEYISDGVTVVNPAKFYIKK